MADVESISLEGFETKAQTEGGEGISLEGFDTVDFTGRETITERLEREKREGIAPLITNAQRQAFFERSGINDLIREDPERLKAKAQNSLGYAEMFNIPPSQAWDLHDELSEEIGLRQEISTEEFIGGATLPVVAAGLASNPVGALLGIAVFEAIGEGESAVINLIEGEKYKAFQKKGISDLLPEDASQLTTDVVDTLDFLGKGLLAHQVFKTSPRLGERIAKQIITEHKAAETIFIDPAELRLHLQEQPSKIGATEASIIAEMKGIGALEGKALIRQSLREGVTIEIPAERITILRDRPWFAKVKQLLKIDPAKEVRTVTEEGAKTFKFGEREVKATEPEQILQLERLSIERAKLEPSKEPEAIERVAEIDREIEGIAKPEAVVETAPIENLKSTTPRTLSQIAKQDRTIIDPIKESISKGEDVPPIQVIKTDEGKLSIFDGHHRVIAHQELGIENVPIEVGVINEKGLFEVKPPPKKEIKAPTKPVAGKVKGFNPDKDSLAVFVKKSGGFDLIKEGKSGGLTGELEIIKDFGKGLVKKGSGVTVDDMLAQARAEGFAIPEDALPSDFLDILEQDLSAETKFEKVFSTAKDFELEIEQEARRLLKEEQGTQAEQDVVKLKAKIKELKEKQKERIATLKLQQRETTNERIAKVKARANAKIDKVKTAKEIVARRRQFVKSAQAQFNLTDADLRKITRRDIRLMSNFEFKQFMDDLRVKAAEFEQTAIAKNALQDLITQKQFRGWNNLRKVLKLPPINKMNEAQAIQLYEELKHFQQEDVFLTVRKLELINRTEFAGAKTIRQIIENAHKVTGIPVSELESSTVTEFDRFKPHTMLAKASPLFEYVVKKYVTRQLGADANYIKVEKEITALANAARKSRNLTAKQKISAFVSPQDKGVFEYLEADQETKLKLVENLTPEEIDYANYMQGKMAEALEYLIENEVLESTRFEGAYITHVRKGLIESIKDGGLKAGIRGLFEKFAHDEKVFNILDQSTGDILALEKFLPQSLFRTGNLDPTKNTARAFLTYWRTLETKKALDAIIPEIDALVYALEPKQITPRGLKEDKSLEKFFKEWINAQKGRAPKLLVKQGGKVDITLRALKTFTTLKDLAFNIPVGVASAVGEGANNFIQIGHKNIVKGNARKRTEQGQLILDKYEHFIGKSVWQEMIEADKDIADKANLVLFGFFHHNMVSANKTFLLGSLTDAEFQAGEISDSRLAQLKLDMGEYRQTIGSESIIGKTPEGKTFNQYKKWAVPILQSTLNNIKTIFKNKDFTSKEAWQIYRSLELVTAVAIVGALYFDGQDDNSLSGRIIRKGYREAMSVLGAINHNFWIAVPRSLQLIKDIMKGLVQLITLEEYQRGDARYGIEVGDLKGVKTLERQITPSAVRQFEGVEEKKKSITRSKIQRR